MPSIESVIHHSTKAKWLRNLGWAALMIATNVCIGIIAYKQFFGADPIFTETEKLINIKYYQLPKSFFKQLRDLNYGYAHLLLTQARAGNAEIKRVGNAVLLIDVVFSTAFLTGEDLDTKTLQIVGKYCKEKRLSVCCDPKYVQGLASINIVADPFYIKDDKLVFLCDQTYEVEKNFGLQTGIAQVEIKKMQPEHYSQTAQAKLMEALFGSMRGFFKNSQGYVLIVNKKNVLAEVFIVCGDRREWQKMGGSLFYDDRPAEIYIFVKSEQHRRKGLGIALTKEVIRMRRKSHPRQKLYWVCDESNYPSKKAAEKLGLTLVEQLTRISYSPRRGDGMVYKKPD